MTESKRDGKVYGEESFLCAGVADEEIEAGAQEETFDQPFELGRRVERIAGSAQDADGAATIFADGKQRVDGELELH